LPPYLISSNFENGKVEMKVNEESWEIKIFDKGGNWEIVLLWSGVLKIIGKPERNRELYESNNYDLRWNNQWNFFLDDSRKQAIIEILKQNNN